MNKDSNNTMPPTLGFKAAALLVAIIGPTLYVIGAGAWQIWTTDAVVVQGWVFKGIANFGLTVFALQCYSWIRKLIFK